MIDKTLMVLIHNVQITSYNWGFKSQTTEWWDKARDRDAAMFALCEYLEKQKSAEESHADRLRQRGDELFDKLSAARKELAKARKEARCRARK